MTRKELYDEIKRLEQENARLQHDSDNYREAMGNLATVSLDKEQQVATLTAALGKAREALTITLNQLEPDEYDERFIEHVKTGLPEPVQRWSPDWQDDVRKVTDALAALGEPREERDGRNES